MQLVAFKHVKRSNRIYPTGHFNITIHQGYCPEIDISEGIFSNNNVHVHS